MNSSQLISNIFYYFTAANRTAINHQTYALHKFLKAVRVFKTISSVFFIRQHLIFWIVGCQNVRNYLTF